MPMDFYQGTDEAFMEHCNMKDSKLANLLRLVLGEDLVEVEANPKVREDNSNAVGNFIFKQTHG